MLLLQQPLFAGLSSDRQGTAGTEWLTKARLWCLSNLEIFEENPVFSVDDAFLIACRRRRRRGKHNGFSSSVRSRNYNLRSWHRATERNFSGPGKIVTAWAAHDDGQVFVQQRRDRERGGETVRFCSQLWNVMRLSAGDAASSSNSRRSLSCLYV